MAPDSNLVSSLAGYGTVLNVGWEDLHAVCAFRREKELEAIGHRIEQAGNRSFVLRGPSGCGKTAILREFVRRRPLDDENEVSVGLRQHP
jgi:ABC-type phosphate transport system ATPase subunit